MTKIKDLHKTWSRDPDYLKEYQALEEEFTVMAAIARARRRSGLSQAELARRMNTTQSAVARLESGRGATLKAVAGAVCQGNGAYAENQFSAGEGKAL